jgi:uncharacterized protein (TIGR03437 family)
MNLGSGLCFLTLTLPFVFTSGIAGQTIYITTVAGNGVRGFSGDNGPATSAEINGPYAVAVDSSGSFYITDYQRIRKVSGGEITTIAGTGVGGFSGDGGPAINAMLNAPAGVAVDSSGNIYIADLLNSRVREISNGIITTILGNPGNDPVSGAQVLGPVGLALDRAGNLFIADKPNNRVLKYAKGVATVVAGTGVFGYAGDNGPAASALLYAPSGVAVDPDGNVYIADTNNQRIRKVLTDGTITTVAGNGNPGYSGDNGLATSAMLNSPLDVALDASGSLYIVDTGNERIRKVSDGVITTIAGGGPFDGPLGDDGPATNANLFSPSGLATDYSSGNQYIADTGDNQVRLLSTALPPPLTITTTSLPTAVAGTFYSAYMAAINGSGGYSWSATRLPQNFTITPQGVFQGTPATTGKFQVTFTVTSGVSTASLTLSLTVVPAPGNPTITTGGVVPLFSTVNTIQPGEWISIYGTNLGAYPIAWNGDFTKVLGKTSVTVNGKPGYLSYVSPTQINLQAPDDTTTGPVPVVVLNSYGGGFETATSTVTLAPFAPSFSLLDSKHVAGIILRSDGSGAYGGGTYDIIGPTGNSLGYPTVAAKAGDIVSLFGVGFGPTTPFVPAGQSFSGAATANSSVDLTINNINVTPTFAGLSSAGLYQINLTVPVGLGTGDISLEATVGGANTPSGVVISLQ